MEQYRAGCRKTCISSLHCHYLFMAPLSDTHLKHASCVHIAPFTMHFVHQLAQCTFLAARGSARFYALSFTGLHGALFLACSPLVCTQMSVIKPTGELGYVAFTTMEIWFRAMRLSQ